MLQHTATTRTTTEQTSALVIAIEGIEARIQKFNQATSTPSPEEIIKDLNALYESQTPSLHIDIARLSITLGLVLISNNQDEAAVSALKLAIKCDKPSNLQSHCADQVMLFSDFGTTNLNHLDHQQRQELALKCLGMLMQNTDLDSAFCISHSLLARKLENPRGKVVLTDSGAVTNPDEAPITAIKRLCIEDIISRIQARDSSQPFLDSQIKTFTLAIKCASDKTHRQAAQLPELLKLIVQNDKLLEQMGGLTKVLAPFALRQTESGVTFAVALACIATTGAGLDDSAKNQLVHNIRSIRQAPQATLGYLTPEQELKVLTACHRAIQEIRGKDFRIFEDFKEKVSDWLTRKLYPRNS